jgi:DNA-binding transcriptional LysR family regulator
LRYFLAVAEMENISRAATHKLDVSQPSLSRQIRDLEDELGVRLLERTAKSVSLTEAGRTFLLEARLILGNVDEAVRKVRAIADKNHTELHVGYWPIATARMMPAILRAYQKLMPQVRVKLHDWPNQQNLAGLRERRLQLAFVSRPPNSSELRGLRFEVLRLERIYLAVAPTHRLAHQLRVTLSEAAREPFIRLTRETFPDYYNYFTAIFAPTKFKPRVAEELDDISGVISAIEAGKGVSLASDFFGYTVGRRLKLLRLTPEPKPVAFGIAAPKGRLSLAAEKFWQCAKEAAASE